MNAQARRGSAVEYGFGDLVSVRGILSLLEQGVPLRRIRKDVENLRQHVPELDNPLKALRLWAEGSPRIVVRHGDVLLEPDGQAVLDFGSRPESDEQDLVTNLSKGLHRQEYREELAERCFARGCELDGNPSTYAEAIESYLEGIEIDPEFSDCHCNLGAVYYNQGERKTARRCFENCLEIDRHHVEANFNLANLLEEDGCDDMALHHYRCALTSDPLYPDLHANLALLHEKLGRNHHAAEHWRRYLQLDGDGSWADVARRRMEQLTKD